MEILSIPITPELSEKTGATVDVPEDTIYASGIDNYSMVASTVDYANGTDTIYTIAQRNSVDWKQVAALNDIDYPYLIEAGQKIKIPGTAAGTGQISQSPDETEIENLLFGIDEELDKDGNMMLSGSDIACISGMENLAMQLQHRIMTVKGELAELGHPEYGSMVPTFIGYMMIPVWEERILFECRMACEADPRVDYVENSRFYNDGTAIFYEGVVYPINNMDPVLVQIPIA